MDKRYLYTAMRYVERNPVRAGMVERAEDYPWAGAKAHVFRERDILLSDNFMLSKIEDWFSYLAGEDREEGRLFKQNVSSGRPLGDEKFIIGLEKITGRRLMKQKPGRKKKK